MMVLALNGALGTLSMENCLQLSAVRCLQAGKAFYVASVPFHIVARNFQTDSGANLGRPINQARVNRFTKYLTAPRPGHVVPPIHVSVQGDLQFYSAHEQRSVGRLEIELAALLLVVDGRHRVAAIANATALRPGLARETLPVCIHVALSEAEHRSMFETLNCRAVRASVGKG